MIKKIALIGGLTVASLGGLFLYNYLSGDDSTEEENTNQQNIKPKEFIQKVLKDLRSQLFTILIEIVQIREKVLQKDFQNQQEQKIEEKQVHDVLYQQMMQLVKKKEHMICLKYEITPDILSEHINQIYLKDQDIQKIVTDIAVSIDNALKGIGPSLELKQAVLQKLTKSKVLYLVEQILRNSCLVFIECHQQLLDEGEKQLNLQNQKYLKRIRELNLAEKKRQFLMKNGFDQFDDSPTEILGKISQRYKNEDAKFFQIMRQMEKSYEEFMKQLYESSNISTDLINQIYGPEKTEIEFEEMLKQ